jgi:hypothetical protein
VSQAESSSWQPRWPTLVATLVFILAALTVCAPMLAGKFLIGDDQYLAGYAFRAWGAQMFRENGAIPQWNPYLFGGMPFVAAMHGDIFYPTAWLRWVLPIDTAMNLSIAMHLAIAGLAMFAFLRALGLSWTAAVSSGIGYELTGIIASMVSPGHDGKLYVSALAPFAFLALLHAIRHQKLWGYGLLSLIVGLCLLTPHYQMSYYLLVACGLWTLYLAFFDSDRPAGRKWYVPVGLAAAAVLIGVGISAIQAVPFLKYIPYSPRGTEGPSKGWEYATGWAMPVEESFTTILPQFNGVLGDYWGSNRFKSHSEYLGAVVVVFAILGWGDRRRRRLMVALGAIGGLFLLVAFGAHTPFYRLWYEVMPMMKSVRAAGMAFFIPALVIAVYAGIGVERLITGQLRWRSVAIVTGAVGGFALLGAAGGLQVVAETLAKPEQMARAAANADSLRGGAVRLLLVVGSLALVAWLVLRNHFRGALAAVALALLVTADLWSIDRLFFHYQPPAAELFKDDGITAYLKQVKPPFRAWQQWTGDSPMPYRGSTLMSYSIQQPLGYHGQEVHHYDELLGGKNVYQNNVNRNVLDLLAVRFVILTDSVPLPGFRYVTGPVTTTQGLPGVLYEIDSVPPYVRVLPAAAKVPDAQIVPTVTDPRFPYDRVVLYSDTASVSPDPIEGTFLPPSPVKAQLAEWKPGSMRIRLDGSAPKDSYLLVAETWYPDWRVTIDGNPAPVHRGDNALISVVLPSGAREVQLDFHDRGYGPGKTMTAVAVLLTAGLILVPLIRSRKGATAGV